MANSDDSNIKVVLQNDWLFYQHNDIRLPNSLIKYSLISGIEVTKGPYQSSKNQIYFYMNNNSSSRQWNFSDDDYDDYVKVLMGLLSIMLKDDEKNIKKNSII